MKNVDHHWINLGKIIKFIAFSIILMDENSNKIDPYKKSPKNAL